MNYLKLLIIPAGFFLIGFILLLFYFIAPLWLLQIWRKSDNAGPAGKIIVPIIGISVTDCLQVINLWMLPLLALRPRVLNAWVARYNEKWIPDGFENNAAVDRRRAG